ncbi:hypothetical protein KR054_011116 [Drosophila jambulina]|nr:hypothetical protein KR054_011116 [Drosophila jambulina]
MAKLSISYILLSLFVAISWSLHRFEVEVIKKLSAEYKDAPNFVISPFAIHQALAMLYVEKDKARDYQLARVLRLTGKGTDQILSYFSEEHRKAINQKFRTANQIYYPKNFNIPPNMMKMSSELSVDVANIPFSDGQTAGDTITEWISKSIKGVDSELWGNNMPTDKTKFVAVQGLLVKPNWKHKFEWFTFKKFTNQKPGMRSSSVRTKMMYGTGPFPSLVHGNVRGVTIPLSTGNLNLIILMKADGRGCQEILENLNKYLAIKMHKNNKVHLYIPAFTISNTLDLTQGLESFGIKKVMAKKPPPKGKILPTAIFKQLNALKVQPRENQFLCEYVDDDDIKVIRIDKPFVFVIRDPKTIYMAGRVNSLKEEK